MCQSAQESFAPNSQTLGTDIANIVNNGEYSQNLALPMQGHGYNVNGSGSKLLESVGISIVSHRLGSNGWRRVHERGQRRRHLNNVPFRAIHGEAG